MDIVLNFVKPFRALVFALSLTAVGCHAQTAAEASAGTKLSPEMTRRVEAMIRSRTDLPPEYMVLVGPRTKSEVPGYDQIGVTFSAEGKTSKPLIFLLSADGKTLAQFNKFDISQDPRLKVSQADRPGRGGPADAPVLIVLFDDLECPFCAQMHATLFPDLTDRYKEQVRIVYRDFPLDQHPWAVRAAIDANCLAAGSHAGYWNYVDYVHAHAAELGGGSKSVAAANSALDAMAMDEGMKQKVSPAALKACLDKQDDSGVKATKKEAEALGVGATPAIFINGEKVEGAKPLELIYRMIDEALTAEGKVPPPPYVPPAETPASAVKPGN